MWFDQAVGKLVRNTVKAYNPNTARWDTLPFNVQLTSSNRRSGRAESFYNRRVILAPQRIDRKYQVLKVSSDATEYLIFTEEQNIVDNDDYYYEYPGLVSERSYAQLQGLIPTLSASGISGTKVVSNLGSYPIAMERQGVSMDSITKDVAHGIMNCYIPWYANPKEGDTLIFDNRHYLIREVTVELSLNYLALARI